MRIISIKPHAVTLGFLEGRWEIEEDERLNNLYLFSFESENLWKQYEEYLKVLVKEYCLCDINELTESGIRMRNYLNQLVVYDENQD